MRYAIEKSSGRRLSKISMSDIGAWLHHALARGGCREKEPLLVGAIGAAAKVRHDMSGLWYRKHCDAKIVPDQKAVALARCWRQSPVWSLASPVPDRRGQSESSRRAPAVVYADQPIPAPARGCTPESSSRSNALPVLTRPASIECTVEVPWRRLCWKAWSRSSGW